MNCCYAKSKFTKVKCNDNEWMSSEPYFVDGSFLYACENHAKEYMKTVNPFGTQFVCVGCMENPCICLPNDA